MTRGSFRTYWEYYTSHPQYKVSEEDLEGGREREVACNNITIDFPHSVWGSRPATVVKGNPWVNM